MTGIPFYRPSLPPLEEYVRLLRTIWDSRMLSNFGSFSQELESKAARYLKTPFVKSVVSADIGLIITLKALELTHNSPCYVSDFTFNSTINTAIWAGLRPVIVDADPKTFNISIEHLSNAIKANRRPGVILATHVFGAPADVESLQKLATENNCFLVFDAAHALGSRRDGRPVGTFGDAEVFSLSGTKLVTSAEGGLISTSHEWLAERITYLRAYGFQNDYMSKYVGLNGKISEIHCALGILALDQIEALLQRREEIVDYYKKSLGNRVEWQSVRQNDRSTYKDISIGLHSSRLKVEKMLQEQGIQTKRYFVPLHRMTPYLEFATGTYSTSEHIYESTICLPAYADLTTSELDRISDTVLAGLNLS